MEFFLAEEILPNLIAEFAQANLDFFNLFVKPFVDDFFDGGERNVGTQLAQEADGFRLAFDRVGDVLEALFRFFQTVAQGTRKVFREQKKSFQI